MAEAGTRAPETEASDAPGPERRPAFYALSPGGWRDVITVLHPPYTAWHLSWAALGAFFLAVGIGAHALDELHGHPLGTRLSDRTLVLAAGVALAGAVGIGVVGLFVVSVTLLPFVTAGAFGVLAYNLELFGGRFHTDFWFAAAWGAFPALTGFWAMALGIHSAGEAVAGIAVTGACFGLSLAQRRLSTPARELRRRTISVQGAQRLADGTTRELTAERLSAPLDGALKVISASVVLLAVAAVAIRL